MLQGCITISGSIVKGTSCTLVAYDGFNPSELDTEFVSVMDEAKRLDDYIEEQYDGKIDVLYALRKAQRSGDGGCQRYPRSIRCGQSEKGHRYSILLSRIFRMGRSRPRSSGMAIQSRQLIYNLYAKKERSVFTNLSFFA